MQKKDPPITSFHFPKFDSLKEVCLTLWIADAPAKLSGVKGCWHVEAGFTGNEMPPSFRRAAQEEKRSNKTEDYLSMESGDVGYMLD